MLRPRDLGGIDYIIRAETEEGRIHRIFRAFDREDALEQLINYCRSEDLRLQLDSIEVDAPFRPDGDRSGGNQRSS